MIQSTNSLTVADLMGDDHAVYLNRNKDFGYDIHVEGYDTDTEFEEKFISEPAIDSFAEFCKRFLMAYHRANSLPCSSVTGAMGFTNSNNK
jgi:hypothetical protein